MPICHAQQPRCYCVSCVLQNNNACSYLHSQHSTCNRDVLSSSRALVRLWQRGHVGEPYKFPQPISVLQQIPSQYVPHILVDARWLMLCTFPGPSSCDTYLICPQDVLTTFVSVQFSVESSLPVVPFP